MNGEVAIKEKVGNGYKPYPEYTDSGVEWLGEIPKDWTFVPLTKYMIEITDYRGATPEKVQEGTFLLTAKNIRVGYIDYECSQEFVSSNQYSMIMRRGFPKKGDIVFTTEAPLGNVAILDREDLAIAQRVLRFRVNGNSFIPSFCVYAMVASVFQHQLSLLATGSTAIGIKASKLNKLLLPMPSIEVQKDIAIFLDLTTQKIDSLIEKKERFIELLQEKRTALITHAVTKGLDPDVPMKDSGIEWLGEIPEHWKVNPLFSLMKEQKERNVGNLETNVLSLSYGKIIRRDVSDNFGLLPESFETYQKVNPGNIILRLTDLQNDKKSLRVGFVEEKGIITSAYLCLKPGGCMFPNYVSLLLHSYDTEKIFYSYGGGVRQSMKFEDLKWLPLLFPPLAEQKRIVSFVHFKINIIDSLINKTRQSIELLKEYRTALITAAVTGKIDLREEVAL